MRKSRRQFLKVIATMFPMAFVTNIAWSQEGLRELRDEGIRNIGWVAGNAYGHPIWPQVKQFVGEGGEYYNTFLAIAPRGSDHETEAYRNVSLYREWFEKGQNERFDEPECMRRIMRVLQIIEEMTVLIR